MNIDAQFSDRTRALEASLSRIKVSVEGVVKTYPSETSPTGHFVALSNINLEIADGEFVSLLGPSGCGKSTLLEIVAGLQMPNDGTVLVDGNCVAGPGPDRTVMFQHYALFPWRTALDNVAYPLQVAHVGRRERRERAMDYLRIVGLEFAADRYPSQLSGGMQQRVALARALACDPKVLLMDEPFSGADAITREMLQEHLLKVQRTTGKTILFVTHSVDEAIHLSDRIIVMGTKPGRIVREFAVDRHNRVDESYIKRSERLIELKETLWLLLRNILEEAGAQQWKTGSSLGSEQRGS